MALELIDEYRNTPLIKACSAEDFPAAVQLIEEGADINAVNKFGETPLLEATRYAYKNEKSALDLVNLLLDKRAGINAQTIEGETALMRATYYGYGEIVHVLLDRGADVNLRRNDGDTVLSSVEAAPSIINRRRKIIKMLEKAGAIR